MEYRQLGNSGIEVSVIALGCWAFANDHVWGTQATDESIATVHAALDVGVNLFDTAEGYGAGHSEEVLGRALKGRRGEGIVATKVSPNHLRPDDLVQACEASLRRLDSDYIDLYQIHFANHDVPIDDTMAALEKLRSEGKIRAIGVCNFGPIDMRDLARVGAAQTNQLPYSLLWRVIEHEILPVCQELGMGILCYSPLAQGLLTGAFSSPDEVPAGQARTRLYSTERESARHGEPGCEAEVFAALERVRAICQEIGQPMANVSLAWLLHKPGITSILAGGRHPEEIRANVDAVALELDDDTVQALAEATEAVKPCLGTNADPWQAGETTRVR